jgi:single-strand DNA-binding protein
MASLNKMQVIGTLGRDPDMKTMPNGDSIAVISVATSESFKDKNSGDKRSETEWHRIIFKGKLAEIVGQYLRKGSSVYVEGRLKTRKYIKNEIEYSITEIMADNMQMLGGKPADATQTAHTAAPAQAPAAKSDAPF